MTYMLLVNCALKLVEEIILYYDARSKKHKKVSLSAHTHTHTHTHTHFIRVSSFHYLNVESNILKYGMKEIILLDGSKVMCPELFPFQLPKASNRSHVAFRRPTGCAPLPHVNKARTTKHSLGRTEHYHLLELSHLSTNLNLTLNMAVVYRRFTIIATQGAIVELQCTSGARVIAILS